MTQKMEKSEGRNGQRLVKYDGNSDKEDGEAWRKQQDKTMKSEVRTT